MKNEIGRQLGACFTIGILAALIFDVVAQEHSCGGQCEPVGENGQNCKDVKAACERQGKIFSCVAAGTYECTSDGGWQSDPKPTKPSRQTTTTPVQATITQTSLAPYTPTSLAPKGGGSSACKSAAGGRKDTDACSGRMTKDECEVANMCSPTASYPAGNCCEWGQGSIMGSACACSGAYPCVTADGACSGTGHAGGSSDQNFCESIFGANSYCENGQIVPTSTDNGATTPGSINNFYYANGGKSIYWHTTDRAAAVQAGLGTPGVKFYVTGTGIAGLDGVELSSEGMQGQNDEGEDAVIMSNNPLLSPIALTKPRPLAKWRLVPTPTITTPSTTPSATPSTSTSTSTSSLSSQADTFLDGESLADAANASDPCLFMFSFDGDADDGGDYDEGHQHDGDGYHDHDAKNGQNGKDEKAFCVARYGGLYAAVRTDDFGNAVFQRMADGGDTAVYVYFAPAATHAYHGGSACTNAAGYVVAQSLDGLNAKQGGDEAQPCWSMLGTSTDAAYRDPPTTRYVSSEEGGTGSWESGIHHKTNYSMPHEGAFNWHFPMGCIDGEMENYTITIKYQGGDCNATTCADASAGSGFFKFLQDHYSPEVFANYCAKNSVEANCNPNRNPKFALEGCTGTCSAKYGNMYAYGCIAMNVDDIPPTITLTKTTTSITATATSTTGTVTTPTTTATTSSTRTETTPATPPTFPSECVAGADSLCTLLDANSAAMVCAQEYYQSNCRLECGLCRPSRIDNGVSTATDADGVSEVAPEDSVANDGTSSESVDQEGDTVWGFVDEDGGVYSCSKFDESFASSLYYNQCGTSIGTDGRAAAQACPTECGTKRDGGDSSDSGSSGSSDDGPAASKKGGLIGGIVAVIAVLAVGAAFVYAKVLHTKYDISEDMIVSENPTFASKMVEQEQAAAAAAAAAAVAVAVQGNPALPTVVLTPNAIYHSADKHERSRPAASLPDPKVQYATAVHATSRSSGHSAGGIAPSLTFAMHDYEEILEHEPATYAVVEEDVDVGPSRAGGSAYEYEDTTNALSKQLTLPSGMGQLQHGYHEIDNPGTKSEAASGAYEHAANTIVAQQNNVYDTGNPESGSGSGAYEYEVASLTLAPPQLFANSRASIMTSTNSDGGGGAAAGAAAGAGAYEYETAHFNLSGIGQTDHRKRAPPLQSADGIADLSENELQFTPASPTMFGSSRRQSFC